MGDTGAKKVNKVIAVMSGRGGVGKSSITGILAVLLARKGCKAGILDADIDSPGIPKIFGMNGPMEIYGSSLMPFKSSLGIKIGSINLNMDNDKEPVSRKGPVVESVVKQLWSNVAWGELDYLLVNLPAGTSGETMTALQLMHIDGIILVSTPQELALHIAKKAANMATRMEKPVIGVVENMSYAKCPHCQESIEVFGSSHAREAAKKIGIHLLGSFPMDPDFTRLCQQGDIEKYDKDIDIYLDLIFACCDNSC